MVKLTREGSVILLVYFNIGKNTIAVRTLDGISKINGTLDTDIQKKGHNYQASSFRHIYPRYF